MATSLLAHLYSHIKGSQEDVATLSLQYILSQSNKLNQSFTRLLSRALQIEIDGELNYTCQATGENKERPDIAGIDADGNEIILCEAKFYAGLTSNQPVSYLKRLKDENGLGLVFICPAVRKVTLWSKLVELCGNLPVEIIDDNCISVDGVRMAIMSWNDVVESLRFVASTEATEMLPDIYQLDGFCKMMDSEAFIPFSSEDFGPENAMREERYYQVIDAVFDRLMADEGIYTSAKGLRAAPYRNGYVRYICGKNWAFSISYDRPTWKQQGKEETPFWLTISDNEFSQPISIIRSFDRYPESFKGVINGMTALPLFAPTNVPLDDVAEEIKRQILEYFHNVEGILE